MNGSQRRDEIRGIHREYRWFYALLFVAVALGIGIGFAASEFADDSRGFWMNVVTEGIGVAASVAITVIVIDRFYERRERERLKRRLVREAGSRSNDRAITAIDELRSYGWLTGADGLLADACLSKANMKDTDLSSANFRNADLIETNLSKATLHNAKLHGASMHNADLRSAWAHDAVLRDATMWNVQLQDARFIGVDLQDAHLDCARMQNMELLACNLENATAYRAHLQDADLRKSNLNRVDLRFAVLENANLWQCSLQGANLIGAVLHSADLTGANLEGAYLSHADLTKACVQVETISLCNQTATESATLPDGTEWSQGEDTRRFTDRDHPQYLPTLAKVNRIRESMGVKVDPSA